jgi:hypothetical protein
VIAPPGRARLPARERGPAAPEAAYRVREAVAPAEVDRPISGAEVRRIASKGFPLWEAVPVMQLRNRRITVAYADLSRRLADLLARGGGERQANWCTYATWSSRTIGNWIDPERRPSHTPRRGWRGLVDQAATRLTEALAGRDNGATYRSLAAGNRYVFLEIGLAVACFLEHFEKGGGDGLSEPDWDRYWAHMTTVLDELAMLDPSWLLTESPPPDDLRRGMQQYFEALRADDPAARAEQVLAGNLLVGAYEQRRVDGYVTASLALFTGREMRRLVARRAARGLWWHRAASTVYARVMSRFLVLETHDEELRVARPLPPPAGGPMFPPDLDAVTTPLVQALLTRYDLSEGRPDRRRVRDWTSFDDRMNYIANLFRSRQQHAPLFADPYSPEVERELLAGRLAG